MTDYAAMSHEELLRAEQELQKKKPRIETWEDRSFEGMLARSDAEERWKAELARIAEAKPPALKRKRRIERQQRARREQTDG